MRAMILTAGLGTRLLPITEKIPKPMIPLAGRPLIEHQFMWFKSHGVQEIAINLYHLPQVITDYFGDGSRFGTHITYSPEPELLGTAGGVKKVSDAFRFFNDTFVVYYGDNFTDLNLTEMIAFHKKQHACATVFLRKREKTPKMSSIIELDADSRITTFVEKPTPEAIAAYNKSFFLSNNGIYILEPEVLDFIPSNRFFDFGKDVFPKLIAAGKKVVGFMSQDTFWRELGTIEKYNAAKEEIEQYIASHASSDKKVFK